ncbi:MAG: hypothetical protein PHF86_01695 [Candidatus Nanoarchaeia archaeon]|nr:hypothetical protein [Candidatus Nanoarchaeia archaeon]
MATDIYLQNLEEKLYLFENDNICYEELFTDLGSKMVPRVNEIIKFKNKEYCVSEVKYDYDLNKIIIYLIKR